MINIIQRTFELTSKYEGCRLTSYKDPVGIWTIGYGNRYINNLPVKPNQRITQEVANELLETTLTNLYDQISKLLPGLNDNQMVSILDFSYNVGLYAFEKSTLFKLLKSGNYDDASKEFNKWIYSSGKILPGLVRRRKEETNIFLGLEN